MREEDGGERNGKSKVKERNHCHPGHPFMCLPACWQPCMSSCVCPLDSTLAQKKPHFCLALWLKRSCYLMRDSEADSEPSLPSNVESQVEAPSITSRTCSALVDSLPAGTLSLPFHLFLLAGPPLPGVRLRTLEQTRMLNCHLAGMMLTQTQMRQPMALMMQLTS